MSYSIQPLKEMRFKSLAGVLLLAEVADEVAPFCVCNGHDVEEEGLHVEVERLVVQEELGQQAQVLAVLLVPGNVDAIS